MPSRLIENPNLSLVYGHYYRDLPILEQYTPMIKQYLDRSYEVLYRVLADHGRIAAFRIDLHYPSGDPLPECAYSNKPISVFISSVRRQIEQHRHQSSLRYKRVNDTEFHYLWCREIGKTGRPHYHVYILLNAAAYNSLGDWVNGRNNMAYRFFTAWAEALGMPIDHAQKLVQFPLKNAIHLVSRNDAVGIGLLYQHMSYLCKAYSKQYVNWVHCFGNSRSICTQAAQPVTALPLSTI